MYKLISNLLKKSAAMLLSFVLLAGTFPNLAPLTQAQAFDSTLSITVQNNGYTQPVQMKVMYSYDVNTHTGTDAYTGFVDSATDLPLFVSENVHAIEITNGLIGGFTLGAAQAGLSYTIDAGAANPTIYFNVAAGPNTVNIQLQAPPPAPAFDATLSVNIVKNGYTQNVDFNVFHSYDSTNHNGTSAYTGMTDSATDLPVVAAENSHAVVLPNGLLGGFTIGASQAGLAYTVDTGAANPTVYFTIVAGANTVNLQLSAPAPVVPDATLTVTVNKNGYTQNVDFGVLYSYDTNTHTGISAYTGMTDTATDLPLQTNQNDHAIVLDSALLAGFTIIAPVSGLAYTIDVAAATPTVYFTLATGSNTVTLELQAPAPVIPDCTLTVNINKNGSTQNVIFDAQYSYSLISHSGTVAYNGMTDSATDLPLQTNQNDHAIVIPGGLAGGYTIANSQTGLTYTVDAAAAIPTVYFTLAAGPNTINIELQAPGNNFNLNVELNRNGYAGAVIIYQLTGPAGNTPGTETQGGQTAHPALAGGAYTITLQNLAATHQIGAQLTNLAYTPAGNTSATFNLAANSTITIELQAIGNLNPAINFTNALGNPIGALTLSVGQTALVNVNGTDANVAPQDTLALTIQTNPLGASATFVDPAPAVSPVTSPLNITAQNAHLGLNTFLFNIDDNAGGSVNATFNVTITTVPIYQPGGAVIHNVTTPDITFIKDGRHVTSINTIIGKEIEVKVIARGNRKTTTLDLIEDPSASKGRAASFTIEGQKSKEVTGYLTWTPSAQNQGENDFVFEADNGYAISKTLTIKVIRSGGTARDNDDVDFNKEDCYFDDNTSDSVVYLCLLGIIDPPSEDDSYDGDSKDFSYFSDDPITRAAFTKIMVNITYDESDIERVARLILRNNFFAFPDVNPLEWFAKFISLAKFDNHVHGYPSGDYIPWNYIESSESMKILYNTASTDNEKIRDDLAQAKEDVGPDALWFMPYALLGYAYGGYQPELDRDPGLIYNHVLTRQEAADLIYTTILNAGIEPKSKLSKLKEQLTKIQSTLVAI